jgi:xanthine/uracil permease
MAFLPKVVAVIGMIPLLLGRTLVFMFGMIAVVGIQIVSQSMKTLRSILIVAASVGLSAVNFAPVTAFEMVSAGVRILATDGSCSVPLQRSCSI